MIAERHDVVTSDARIGVTVRGEGPTVLVIPSQGRGVADFADLAERLVEAGRRVVMPEPRGIGASRGSNENITLAVLAGDAAAVIDRLGGGPADVIGHAYGNRVARMLATIRPDLVRRVVLLAAGGKAPVPDDVAAAFDVCFRLDAPEAERLAAIGTVFFAAGNDARVWLDGWSLEAAALQAVADGATPVETWWHAGSAPLLVIQGLEDRMALPANGRMLKGELGARVTLVELTGASHALLPERPDAIAETVIGYLK